VPRWEISYLFITASPEHIMEACCAVGLGRQKARRQEEGREEKSLFLSILDNQGKVVSLIKLFTTVPSDNLNCELA
jgi:hypothetical protein